MLCGEKRYIYIPCKLSKFKLSISNCSYLPSLDQAMILFLNVLFELHTDQTNVVSVLD